MSKGKKKLKKRTWHYCMQPAQFDMYCDKCEGRNITWSEFEHLIWCYDCKIDTKGFDGVFGGPIPVAAAGLLGLSFARLNMELNQIEYPHHEDHKIVFRPEIPKDYIGPTFELKPKG